MNKFILITCISLCISSDSLSQTDSIFKNFTRSEHKYIQEKKPGLKAELFLPDLFDYSKHHIHSAPVFSPDMTEMFFSAYIKYEKPQRIFRSVYINGKWSKPEELHFSNQFQIGGPVFSQDGNRVYFYCKKPFKGDKERINSIIWFTEKINNKWSDLKPIYYNYDTTMIYVPTYLNENELYFTSGINGKSFSIFKGKIDDDKLTDVRKLNSYINTEGFNNGMAVLNKKGNAIIFWRFSRSGEIKSNLYISFEDKNGEYTPAIDMGEIINEGGARFAGFTPGGKYLFFLTYRNEHEKIYWIDSKIIKQLKKQFHSHH